MAVLRLHVNKNVAFAEGIEAAFTELTPLSGEVNRRVQTMIPVGLSAMKSIEIGAGDWLIQSRLPSGECLTANISVGQNDHIDVPLQAAPSSHETHSWPTTFSQEAALPPFFTRSSAEDLETLSFGGSLPTLSLRKNLDDLTLSIQRGQDLGSFEADQDWSLVGGTPQDGMVVISTARSQLPGGARAFATLSGHRLALALPLPWSSADTTMQVRAVPDLRGKPGDMLIRAWVLDPQVSPVLSFLEADDLEPARMLAEQTATWAEDMLQEKGRNPLAAAAGALALLRMREHKRLHDWPLNLAARFDWLPDGAAIAAWCSLMLGMGADGNPAEEPFESRATRAFTYVETAVRRGAPYFCDSVRLLRHVCMVLQHSENVPGLSEHVSAWIEQLFLSVRPQSFIALYDYEVDEKRTSLLTPPSASPEKDTSMPQNNDQPLEELKVPDKVKQQFAPIIDALKVHAA